MGRPRRRDRAARAVRRRQGDVRAHAPELGGVGEVHRQVLLLAARCSARSRASSLPSAASGYSDGHRHQLQLALFSDLDWAKYQASLRGGALLQRAREARDDALGRPLVARDRRRAPRRRRLRVRRDRRGHRAIALLVRARGGLRARVLPAALPALDFCVHFLNGELGAPGRRGGHATLRPARDARARRRVRARRRAAARAAREPRAGALAATAPSVAAPPRCRRSRARRSCCTWGVRRRRQGLRCAPLGRPPVDFYADTCQNLSELVVVVVVVSVACGWTLVDGAGGAANVKKMGALGAGVGALQLVLELVGRRYEADFSSFHDHDHWPGAVLMLLRAAVCAVVGAARCARAASARAAASTATAATSPPPSSCATSRSSARRGSSRSRGRAS